MSSVGHLRMYKLRGSDVDRCVLLLFTCAVVLFLKIFLLKQSYCHVGRNRVLHIFSYLFTFQHIVFNLSIRTPYLLTILVLIFEGGGRVVRRCCVSYITGASN